MTEDALHSAYARMGASALTWPIEKGKLLFQAQPSSYASPISSHPSGSSAAAAANASPSPGGGRVTSSTTTASTSARTRTRMATAAPCAGPRGRSGTVATPSVVGRFLALSPSHHAMGMASSALQRGGSAFFMFYAQASIYRHVVAWREMTDRRPSSRPPRQDDRRRPRRQEPQAQLQQQHPQQPQQAQAQPSYIANQALAGLLSGALTAPFHTFWELIKVRGSFPTSRMYLLSLPPMIGRHAIFDGLFFGTQASLLQLTESAAAESAAAESAAVVAVQVAEEPPSSGRKPATISTHHGGVITWATHYVASSSGVRLGLAAAVASMGNLLWDVWKTRQMSAPTSGKRQRVLFLRDVVGTMTWASFWRQYLVKGTDLTSNWFVRS